MGGRGVFVAGSGVLVGGAGVFVGGSGVLVGGCVVFVGGAVVFVGSAPCSVAVGSGVRVGNSRGAAPKTSPGPAAWADTPAGSIKSKANRIAQERAPKPGVIHLLYLGFPMADASLRTCLVGAACPLVDPPHFTRFLRV